MTYIEEIVKNIPNGLYYLAGAWTLRQIAHLYFVRFCKTEQNAGELTEVTRDIRSKLSGIEAVLDRVCRYLAVKDGLRPDYFMAHSPITLTNLANLGILVDIIALDLRDKYLAKHPEL
ncbi:hypothetical protein COT50_03885 [candidate division WWE3 bacterium CG08_land_8_20_14_0_20_41_10]|uniref:Uncharacterized protein n=1 Tax=candidate division WWE3 bacterium CG08_land_8_20_14_0_20_41_10 TaxID=1975085 RepID=A0A2H0XB46_UNCKA|nr:MAG: hypothetical protein COT50_03885 [candidate division WWE3 bacterium CG08_land_8_20_14_0_20_41_10]